MADRADPASPFVEAQRVEAAGDGTAAGLTSDGLTLLLTSLDGQPYAMSRPNLAGAFGPARPDAFAVGGEASFVAPVAAPAGAFLSVRFTSVGQMPFTYATLVDGRYRLLERLVPSAELLVTKPSTDGPRPTGVSKDLRTLFFWDDVRGVERAAFRAGPGCGFTTVVDLGPLPGAQPNDECTALYFADPQNGGRPARVPRKP